MVGHLKIMQTQNKNESVTAILGTPIAHIKDNQKVLTRCSIFFMHLTDNHSNHEVNVDIISNVMTYLRLYIEV